MLDILLLCNLSESNGGDMMSVVKVYRAEVRCEGCSAVVLEDWEPPLCPTCRKQESKLKMWECDCEICSRMCKAPCCGTVEEMKAIMDAGYGERLMLDEWPGAPEMLKPALKGCEGQTAPWNVMSEQGCTFWKNGLCELHDLGLKPLGGRFAHHSLKDEHYDGLRPILVESWQSDEASDLIEEWKPDGYVHVLYLSLEGNELDEDDDFK